MRFLVLGGDGMLGHQLLTTLGNRHDVRVTLRRDVTDYAVFDLFDNQNASYGVDVRSSDRLAEVFADFRPEVVVNAVGIVKQRSSAKDALLNIEINSVLPHRLAVLCAASSARLIQISTDCVFSGRAGGYTESDQPDPVDLYGRSKLLGEVADAPHCITLRTSIVGRELGRKQGLLEWFLAQRGTVRGFARARFSGLSTLELSRVIEQVAVKHPAMHGLYHVSAEPIDKASLLGLFKASFGASVEVEPDPSVVIDRSLDSGRFRAETGYRVPPWPDMVAEMACDTH